MRRHPWALLVGASILAGLLVLLGALQVRWLDQVAQTITTEQRASLYRRGSALAQDLDRELTRAFAWFVMEEPSDPRAVLERWQSWAEAGRHAALVKEVLVREGDQLFAVDGNRRRLSAIAWPAALEPLRAGLLGPIRLFTRLPAGELVLAVPAGAQRWLLVRLDRAYLAGTLLPALGEEHLGGARGAAVVAEVREAEGDTIYSWPEPGVLVRPGEHDPITFGGLRPEAVTPALLAGMRPPSSAGVPSLDALRRRRRSGSREGRGPRPSGRWSPPWTLSVAYAAGPVDDLVAGLRQRNAVMAFGILTLLGGALAALAVAFRRAQTLAERQRQFMAGVSHELRTPLAVIAAAAENLRDGTVADPDRVREYGGLVHAESRRLHAMVDDVLRLAAGQQLEAGLRHEPLELLRLVDAAVEVFAAEARARGGQIERLPFAGPALVEGDGQALRQAVENVVGNAVKYGGERPRVTVRLTRVDGQLHLAVEDQGLGIPDDELAQLYQPFFRGRQAVSRQIRGTGLGLALVARVMKAHGGAVEARSLAGRGSCFTLRLPACPAPAGAVLPLPAEEPSPS